LDYINLNSFLKFGYFLNYKNPNYLIELSEIRKNEYSDCYEKELVDIGIELFKKAIITKFDYNQKHVVPLSGGLDSRAILSTLLELTEAKNIYTYTFGTPGTWDFDIGNLVAKVTGTNHVNYPLTEYEYKIEELIEISRRIDHQTTLFLHAPISEIEKQFSGFNIWSGAIIDVFFGRHTHKKKADNLEDAKINFINENIYCKSIDLTNVKNNEYFNYISYYESTKRYISFEHALDLINRQLKYIAPHVLMKGFNYKVLFKDKKLTDFSLSIDENWHKNQYLYKKMFLQAFPELFNLPYKSNLGLPVNANNLSILKKRTIRKLKKYINRVHPFFPDKGVNYINFNEAIRTRKDVRTIIYNNIMDLKNRKLLDWVNIDLIWDEHINKKKDHAEALITLASLEIHIKAGKEI